MVLPEASLGEAGPGLTWGMGRLFPTVGAGSRYQGTEMRRYEAFMAVGAAGRNGGWGGQTVFHILSSASRAWKVQFTSSPKAVPSSGDLFMLISYT